MKHINEKLKKERDALQQQLESSSQVVAINYLLSIYANSLTPLMLPDVMNVLRVMQFVL